MASKRSDVLRLLAVGVAVCTPTLALAQADPQTGTIEPASPTSQPTASPTPGAVAQSTAVVASDADQGGIGDIVVTAQRRSENLQKTPIAVTAITGAQLLEQGVVDARSLQNVVPGLTSNDQGQVFLRGIGTAQSNEIADPSVATNLDGVYVARPQALAAAGYFDVARVEVLKGPQGTLYGRNTTGGVINVISNLPTHRFEGQGSVEFGNYDSLSTSGFVNVPVTDTFALRAAFQTVRHDGYLESINTAKPAEDNADTKAIRLTAAFDPTSNLSIIVSGDYLADNSRRGLYGQTIRSIQPGAVYTAKKSTGNTPAINDSEYGGIRGQIDWRVGPGHLIYVGAYRFADYNNQDDYYWSYSPAGTVTGGIQTISSSWTAQHELRYTGDIGALQFTVGGFLFKERGDADARIILSTGVPFRFFYPRVGETSEAAFGQATYSLTDRFRATGGIRWTEDTKFREGNLFIGTGSTLPAVQFPTTGSAPFDARYTWRKVTWKAGVDFDLTPQSLLFANVSTGFKAGGYNDGDQTVGGATPYNPETLTAYEIGSKNRFFDNRVQLNLDLYYYDYKDLQQQAFVTRNGIQTTLNTNATSAKVYGLDADLIVRPTPNDQIDGNLSLLHAEYGSWNNATVLSQPADLTGETLPFSPKLAFFVGYQHGFDVADGRVVARVQTKYTGTQYLDYQLQPISRQGDYTKTDLTLTYTAPNARWSLQGYLRNIEGNRVLQATQVISATQAGVIYSAPRTVGARLTANF